MFTGIVREVGTVAALSGGDDGVRVEIDAPATAPGVALGDSVAVNGVCLTVVAAADGRLSFDAVPETLGRTALRTLDSGSRVNLEPALRAGDPMGGHVVQGHVDGVGAVRSLEPEGDGVRIWVDAPPGVLRYLVEKGSVAVQGTSLTVAGLDERGFAIALIPHTLSATTLGGLAAGDPVNLEADVLAKYVERLLPR
jgi:riboflavin synthase alpha subunit